MATPLKTLLNTVCAEVNVAQQNSFVGNSVNDAQQLLALANAAGLELMKKYPWSVLCTEYRFTYNYRQTTATATNGSATLTGLQSADLAALQTSVIDGTTLQPTQWYVSGVGIPQDTYLVSGNVPALTVTMNQAASGVSSTQPQTITFSQTKYVPPVDFDRWIDRTMWDKSKHWEMMGPSSPQQWQWLKSGYISTGPRIRFRRLAGYLQFWPALSTNEYLGYEYVSNLWAASATGTAQTQFLADTDTCVFDDRLLITLIKLKYLGAKGLATAAIAEEMSNIFALRTSSELGAPILSLAPRLTEVLIGVNNIPDSGYGQ